MDLEKGYRRLVRRRSPFLLSNRSIAGLAAGTAANIAYGFRNANRATPPSPPNTPKRMPAYSRSRSRGRTVRRRTSRRRSSYSRSRARIGGITTEQRDSSVRYVSRRGRRRTSRFVRRVQDVMLRMGATQTFSIRFGGLTNVSTNQQQWQGQILGGAFPTNNDEVFQAFRNAYGTGVTSTNIDSYRLFIKSICLDIQITNSSDKNMILEMYTLKASKPWTAADRLATQLTTCITETDQPTGFTFTANDPGWTLFQVPQFCQYWTVVRKQQIVISAGETTTLQIRMSMNRMVNGKELETRQQTIRGARALFWSAKGAPEVDGVGTGQQYADGQFVWTSQCTVNYQMPPGNTIIRSATQT